MGVKSCQLNSVLEEIKVLKFQFSELFGDTFLTYKSDCFNCSFENFNLNNLDYMLDKDCLMLSQIDKEISNEKVTLSLEKNLLINKKNAALKNLDIVEFARLSKRIGDVEVQFKGLNSKVKSIEDDYMVTYESNIAQYELIVNAFENKETLEDCESCVYEVQLVNCFWINKICECIKAKIDEGCFDLESIFEMDDFKCLLGNSYPKIKQKVGILCGSK